MSTPTGISPSVRRRAVFLDRDGVLNEERGYVGRVEDFVMLPGVGPALRRLQEAGFLLCVITNQSGIGRGYYTEAAMHSVHAHLEAELARDGVRLARIYFAPESPEQPSRGRKPSPQFLFDARDEFGIDLSASFMVGDKVIDLQCGWNAGLKASVLVRTGHGTQTEAAHREIVSRAWVVEGLTEAVDSILRS
ncbi:MAG: D-glycero-alpha-D-manno-heptose-1,7-bisphosphate 7-phosphatase [Limisphaerales bacterium]